MADCERTHDLPIGCNTVVYAYIDSNGNRVLEMGSVPIPVGASRLKFHRPQKVTIQRAIPPPPPAPVQATPEIMTAVTLPSKKKIPKKKKKATKRNDPPSNNRIPLEPLPAIYENTEYHHIQERKERHEIESRTNTSRTSKSLFHGATDAELADLFVPYNVNAVLYSIALGVVHIVTGNEVGQTALTDAAKQKKIPGELDWPYTTMVSRRVEMMSRIWR
ncbi:hypothetical protein MMC32_008493 [Xylographa parallela]|nr:hypothetical protein [Xylographa parallela]